MIYVDNGKKLRTLTPPNSKLLDVGCGTGNMVAIYCVGMENVQIFGVDSSCDPSEVQPFINYTKQNVDGSTLPYDHNIFDTVVLCHLLEHVRESVNLIKEVHRVLRPNGVIYIETPSVRSMLMPELRFMNSQYAAINFFDDYTHNGRPQSIHSLFHLLDRNGFDVMEVEYARPKLWIVKGVRKAIVGLSKRNRRLLCQGLWYLSGWAVYGIARKNPTKRVPHYA